MALALAIAIPAHPARADSFRDDQWYLKTLKMSQAHAISKGAGVTVAVVDSGSYPHPDVRRNILPGTNLMPTGGVNGRSDKNGHGTNMAAIIAAHGRSSNDGVLGIAPLSKVMPVKITDTADRTPANEMSEGITWSASQGAQVINVSAETGPTFRLTQAVKSAIESNVIVVAGVGNKSAQAIIAYPAAIDGVLVVGAENRNGEHAPFSVTDRRVQICAPGVDITTAQPRNKYVDVDGTSAATAIVSGAAALVRAKYPAISGREVIHRLTATADDIGPPGRDDECGFGRLNIVKALTADVPPLEGGGNAAPSSGSPASSAPSVIRPEVVAPSAAARADSEPSGGSSALVFGGVAGVVALAGVLIAVGLRRRRRG